jgi:hypothetical protein
MARLPLRGLDADEDFAVLKGDDVGRPGNLHKLAMQLGDFPIGNENDMNCP